MENKTAEERFCKVYTEFYGEPIDKAEQITEHRFNGNELMEFCEFYASQQLAEKDKEIERLKRRKLVHQLFIGKVSDILSIEKVQELLRESNESLNKMI